MTVHLQGLLHIHFQACIFAKHWIEKQSVTFKLNTHLKAKQQKYYLPWRAHLYDFLPGYCLAWLYSPLQGFLEYELVLCICLTLVLSDTCHGRVGLHDVAIVNEYCHSRFHAFYNRHIDRCHKQIITFSHGIVKCTIATCDYMIANDQYYEKPPSMVDISMAIASPPPNSKKKNS